MNQLPVQIPLAAASGGAVMATLNHDSTSANESGNRLAGETTARGKNCGIEGHR